MKRQVWIDIAKGIGIILVTVGHTNARHLCGDYVGWWINAFHMPLFFVMAGLCFDETRYPKFWVYLKRKAVALGWPYISLSLFMAVLSIGLYWGNDSDWSFWGQVKPLLFLETRVNTFWFIKTLFEVEIVYWILFNTCHRRWLRGGILVACCIVGAWIIPEGGQVQKINTLLVSLLYYGLGHSLKGFCTFYLKFTETRNRWWISWCSGILLMFVYSIVISLYFHYTVGYWGCLLGNKALFFPLSILAIVGISLLSIAISKLPFVSEVLRWLGVNSIILMAIHGHCGIFKSSWGVTGSMSVLMEYGLFVVLLILLAKPLNILVRFPKGIKKS